MKTTSIISRLMLAIGFARQKRTPSTFVMWRLQNLFGRNRRSTPVYGVSGCAVPLTVSVPSASMTAGIVAEAMSDMRSRNP
jgi:hypothetical protein